MKQYCRYCINGVCHPDEGLWCDFHNKFISVRYAKRQNKCKDFDFCERDAFNPEHKYNPLVKKDVKQEVFHFE